MHHPDPLPRRRSVRLPEYDYSRAGLYFVTVCTDQRVCVLGKIEDDQVHLSEAGRIAEELWMGLPDRFPAVALDAHVVMPNHVHGLIQLTGTDRHRGGMPLGEVVRTFKAATTRQIRTTLDPSFAWQRSYYEHVVRNHAEIEHLRVYIAGNPARWAMRAQSLRAP